MTRWRQRLGEEQLVTLIQESLSVVASAILDAEVAGLILAITAGID